eukprot:m.224030 g.224030  ORF g.224030 m.224030 type:complete len:64 (+) comp15640_c0_seq15:4237-4428(+)
MRFGFLIELNLSTFVAMESTLMCVSGRGLQFGLYLRAQSVAQTMTRALGQGNPYWPGISIRSV